MKATNKNYLEEITRRSVHDYDEVVNIMRAVTPQTFTDILLGPTHPMSKHEYWIYKAYRDKVWHLVGIRDLHDASLRYVCSNSAAVDTLAANGITTVRQYQDASNSDLFHYGISDAIIRNTDTVLEKLQCPRKEKFQTADPSAYALPTWKQIKKCLVANNKTVEDVIAQLGERLSEKQLEFTQDSLEGMSRKDLGEKHGISASAVHDWSSRLRALVWLKVVPEIGIKTTI